MPTSISICAIGTYFTVAARAGNISYIEVVASPVSVQLKFSK
jgi:hypothetical protein